MRSILLASGTLAPLASFAQELRLPFPHRLENPHVINASKQVFACVLGKGVSGKKLNSSYSQRDNESYKVYGHSIVYTTHFNAYVLAKLTQMRRFILEVL